MKKAEKAGRVFSALFEWVVGLRQGFPVLIPVETVLIPVFTVFVFSVSKARWRDVWACFPFRPLPSGFFRKFFVKKSFRRVTSAVRF